MTTAGAPHRASGRGSPKPGWGTAGEQVIADFFIFFLGGCNREERSCTPFLAGEGKKRRKKKDLNRENLLPGGQTQSPASQPGARETGRPWGLSPGDWWPWGKVTEFYWEEPREERRDRQTTPVTTVRQLADPRLTQQEHEGPLGLEAQGAPFKAPHRHQPPP